MATSKPKIAWLNHKGELFRRGSCKSFSYRYEISEAGGPSGAPIVARGTAIIETRYRGQSASWSLQPSVLSPEVYKIGGTFVHPSPENILRYPEPPAPQAVEPAERSTPVTPPEAPEPPPMKPENVAMSEDRKEALREITRRAIARSFRTAGATP